MAEPSFLRRLLLCPMGLCQTFQFADDDDGFWGQCKLCDRRTEGMKYRTMPGFAKVSGASERDWQKPDVQTLAPSLDDLHPAFSEPVTGYMSQTGYELLHVRDGWWTAFCLDRAELNPRGGIVEVEVRLRRVVEP